MKQQRSVELAKRTKLKVVSTVKPPYYVITLGQMRTDCINQIASACCCCCFFLRLKTNQWPLASEFSEFEYLPKICCFWQVRVLAKMAIFLEICKTRQTR
jgi:hypothetical protein